MMPNQSRAKAWVEKFRCAGSGLAFAIRDQPSFWVHLSVAALVLVVASWLRIGPIQWTMLVFSIGGVLAAELFNTSIELLVSVLHPSRHPRIGQALDVAAAAVLVISLTAVVIGLIVLLPPLVERLL